ncbi:MAG: hypothetical protein ACRD2B_07345 [Terriglobia bacterium]
MWHHLRDVRNPHVLDLGPVSPHTIALLVRREAKVYVSDLISPPFEGDARFWDRSGKVPVFLAGKLLEDLPSELQGSLTAILSWNLLDLVPPAALGKIVDRLLALLQPLGVLFCILREPQLKEGVERRWWLETLTSARNEPEIRKPYSYPAISNREIERLLSSASVKTFLTRSGRREILAMRQR